MNLRSPGYEKPKFVRLGAVLSGLLVLRTKAQKGFCPMCTKRCCIVLTRSNPFWGQFWGQIRETDSHLHRSNKCAALQTVKKLHSCPIVCVGATIGRPPTYRSNAFSGMVSCKANGRGRAMLAPTRVFRQPVGRAMLAPTRVFLQPEKKLQAGDLLACNFFIPRRGSFSPFPAFYCPASAICSRVMGSS